jgi:hypothetical protein
VLCSSTFDIWRPVVCIISDNIYGQITINDVAQISTRSTLNFCTGSISGTLSSATSGLGRCRWRICNTTALRLIFAQFD